MEEKKTELKMIKMSEVQSQEMCRADNHDDL